MDTFFNAIVGNGIASAFGSQLGQPAFPGPINNLTSQLVRYDLGRAGYTFAPNVFPTFVDTYDLFRAQGGIPPMVNTTPQIPGSQLTPQQPGIGIPSSPLPGGDVTQPTFPTVPVAQAQPQLQFISPQQQPLPSNFAPLAPAGVVQPAAVASNAAVPQNLQQQNLQQLIPPPLTLSRTTGLSV